MPKKDGDEYIISETGNWNIADGYSKRKILHPLVLCDYYEDLANFGYESLNEELLSFSLPPNDVIRLKSMKRLIKTLIRVIDNSKFALKTPGTKNEVLKYKTLLKKILTLLPSLSHTVYNQLEKTSKTVIKDQDLFDRIMDVLGEIKSKINEPLNKNHLIFTDKEEFDPSKFKERLKKRMEEEG